MSSILEETLRSQRRVWGEVVQRTSRLSSREFPSERPRRILLFGIGSSHFAARLTGFALIRGPNRLRIPVIACPSTSIGKDVLPLQEDWAFAFSHRGATSQTLKALETCENAGAFTLQVSGQGAPAPECVRYVVPTCEQERVEPHTVAVTSAVCAVTGLLLGEPAAEEWEALASMGDPNLEALRERAGDGPALLIGEWEGEWLAREGALKLMEMARLPVRAFGSEEFYHGPKMSQRPEDKLWHISVPGDPRASEIQAAHRIEVFRNTPLAWVPALIELQWLAMAVALNRGLNPDTGVPGA